MTHKNGESSTMYQIPGVWHLSDGGKWSQNFETIMKLQVDDWRNSIWKKKYETYLQRIFEEEGIQLYNMIERNIDAGEERGHFGRVRTYNTGGSSDEEEAEEREEITTDIEESLSKRKIKSLMDYLFDNGEKIPEGIYLELCNKLKEVHEIL